MRKLKYVKLFEQFLILERMWYSKGEWNPNEAEKYFKDFFENILVTGRKSYSRDLNFFRLDRSGFGQKQDQITSAINSEFFDASKFGQYKVNVKIFLEGNDSSPILLSIDRSKIELGANPYFYLYTDKQLGIGNDDNKENAKHKAEIRDYIFSISGNGLNMKISITHQQEKNRFEIKVEGGSEESKNDKDILNVINLICDIVNGSTPTSKSELLKGLLGMDSKDGATPSLQPDMILSKF